MLYTLSLRKATKVSKIAAFLTWSSDTLIEKPFLCYHEGEIIPMDYLEEISTYEEIARYSSNKSITNFSLVLENQNDIKAIQEEWPEMFQDKTEFDLKKFKLTEPLLKSISSEMPHIIRNLSDKKVENRFRKFLKQDDRSHPQLLKQMNGE